MPATATRPASKKKPARSAAPPARDPLAEIDGIFADLPEEQQVERTLFEALLRRAATGARLTDGLATAFVAGHPDRADQQRKREAAESLWRKMQVCPTLDELDRLHQQKTRAKQTEQRELDRIAEARRELDQAEAAAREKAAPAISEYRAAAETVEDLRKRLPEFAKVEQRRIRRRNDAARRADEIRERLNNESNGVASQHTLLAELMQRIESEEPAFEDYVEVAGNVSIPLSDSWGQHCSAQLQRFAHQDENHRLYPHHARPARREVGRRIVDRPRVILDADNVRAALADLAEQREALEREIETLAGDLRQVEAAQARVSDYPIVLAEALRAEAN